MAKTRFSSLFAGGQVRRVFLALVVATGTTVALASFPLVACHGRSSPVRSMRGKIIALWPRWDADLWLLVVLPPGEMTPDAEVTGAPTWLINIRPQGGSWNASGDCAWGLRVGWPFRCMVATGSGDDATQRGCFQDVFTWFLHGQPGWRAMQWRPLWLGLAGNILAFGSAAWVAGGARRAFLHRHRRKRGRCPRCAYDLRFDLRAGCPECGWNRPATASTESPEATA